MSSWIKPTATVTSIITTVATMSLHSDSLTGKCLFFYDTYSFVQPTEINVMVHGSCSLELIHVLLHICVAFDTTVTLPSQLLITSLIKQSPMHMYNQSSSIQDLQCKSQFHGFAD